MSNADVNRLQQVRRIIKLGALSALLALAGTVVVIHVQQRILRHRAEDLLADIRQLNLREATYDDAQTILQRWGPWGHLDGTCSRERCDFNIELSDFAYRHQQFFGAHHWILRAYTLVGGRPAQIRASLTVRNGLVWGKSYAAYIEVPPTSFFDECGYTLIGESGSRSRFVPGFGPGPLHPYYLVGRPGGCKICVMVYARFTPYAGTSDVRRLMQFDLSCLTRWHPCREQGDIMPVAWSEYLRESSSPETHWHETVGCSATAVKSLARDADNVAIVKILANRTERTGDGEPYQVLTVDLVQRLKGAEYWSVGAPRRMLVDNRDVALTATNKTSELRPGTRFIILFRRPWEAAPERPNVVVEQCGAIPATEENLALVLDGVGQDFMAAERARISAHGATGLVP